MLLIYPPIAKATEPPCGIPLLAGSLKAHGIPFEALDMNLGAQEYLLNRYFADHPKKEHYRDLIQDGKTYESPDSYKRAQHDLIKGLNHRLPPHQQLTLGNFTDKHYNPLDSKDLLRCAEEYEDSPFLDYYREALETKLASGTIKHVGISLQYINQALAAFALIGYLREQFGHIKIVLGGGLITSWTTLPGWKASGPQGPFAHLVDRIIAGPGEEALIEYLGHSPRACSRREIEPDFSWMKDSCYYSPGLILPISGSLGCSWKGCRFCPEVAENTPYIHRSPGHVVEQMKRLEQEYSPVLFHILDNEISQALLKTLSQSSLQTPWYGFTKFYPQMKELQFCQDLKEGGCTMLKLGLESGDQTVIDSMNKGIKLEDASLILKNLEQVGIRTYVYILFGTPEEDHQSARKTLKFLENHASSITYINPAIFNLPINNDRYEIEEEFHYTGADLSLYKGYNHPKGWNRVQIRRFLKKELERSPAIKEILSRTPPQYNANHGAFFYRN